ncbi:hypothetical protein AVEN_213173-1 [Araneus ventricosus]|uniref:Uncharacterized protein n=1 Tax=Araneus ventricosus TaxID=182803 RepID=A0A4Y2I5I6_ARAVE|nr:hypothetical protein AVEN_213173-1 [Araneus ventricosus]
MPTRLVKPAIDKLEKIHSGVLLLKKNKSRPSGVQRERERKFVRKVHELFDIADASDITMIKLEEDRKFLIDQRSERNMMMETLDKKLVGMQEGVSECQRGKYKQERKEPLLMTALLRKYYQQHHYHHQTKVLLTVRVRKSLYLCVLC